MILVLSSICNRSAGSTDGSTIGSAGWLLEEEFGVKLVEKKLRC